MKPKPRVRKKRNPHRHVYYGGKCLCGAVRKVTRNEPLRALLKVLQLRVNTGMNFAGMRQETDEIISIVKAAIKRSEVTR